MLIEREEELSTLHGLLTESRRGKGQVALVSGAAGMGKSELLHVFAEEAAAAGALFLGAVGREQERDLPFGVVQQLVRDLPLPAPPRTRIALPESDSAAGPATSKDALAQQARVAHTLCRTLLDIAGTRDLLIGVDDVQYADPASLSCLLHLLPHTRSTAVMLVLSQPDGTRRSDPRLGAELLRFPHYRRIRLAPLSVAGTTALAARELGTERARALGPVYHSISGGNPLLVRGLLGDPHDQPANGDGTEPEVPSVREEFGQAVLACVHRGEPPALGVARMLAVLDDCASPDRVSRLLRVSPDSVSHALRQLEAAGLIDGNRFRHPVARSAVLADTPSRRRGDLRVAAAELLHREGVPTSAVARYLVDAGRVPRRWAVRVLMDAAEESRVDGDLPFAVRCLELASAGSADAPERDLIAVTLTRLEWQLNPSTAAPRLARLAERVVAGILPVQFAVPLFKALMWHGRPEEAGAVIRVLRADDPVGRGLITATREWLRNRHPAMTSLLPAVPAAVDDQDGREPWANRSVLLAETVLGTTLRDGGDQSTAWGAEEVLRSCRLDDNTLCALDSALLALVYADRLDQAAVWTGKLLQEATARRAPTWQATLTAVRAELALRRGDLNAAYTLAQSAMTQLAPRSWGVAVGAPLSTLVLAATAMGADDVAEERLRRSVPATMFQSRYGLLHLYARGQHHLAAGRVHAALDDFLRCGEQACAWDMDLPALVPWRSGAATAHLRLGQRDQVRRLAEEELARPGTAKSRSRGVAMRLLAEIAEPRRRTSLLLEAVSMLRLAGDRLELARALAALSTAQQAIGEVGQARQALYQALQLADQCGARRLRRSLLYRGSEEVPAEPAGHVTDSLSAAERRVASLAALGYSNRETADQLCITVSTVEQHLTRVYRKLNVTSRADLPSELQALAVGTA